MNKALLGKQTWRIIQKLDSFMASVFLPKYYKEEPFTKVKQKPSSTWSWNSIFIGMDVILKGLDIQVWNGKQIVLENEVLV